MTMLDHIALVIVQAGSLYKFKTNFFKNISSSVQNNYNVIKFTFIQKIK